MNLGSKSSIDLARSIAAVCLALQVSACTQRDSEEARVSITLPGSTHSQSIARSKSSPIAYNVTASPTPSPTPNPNSTEPNWSADIPSSISELGCYGIFVGGPEADMSASTCKNGQAAEIMRFGVYEGLYAAGETISLTVRSGPKRRIYLVGLKKVAGSCEPLTKPEPQLTWSNYSRPYLIGQVTADLKAGEQSLEMTAEGRFDDQTALNDCAFLKRSPGTTPGASPTPTPPPAAVAALSMSVGAFPENIGFGSSTTFSLMVTNPNSSDATGMTYVFSGPFTQMTGSCSATLLAGASCSMGVKYTPSAIGVQSGMLQVNAVIGAAGSVTNFALSGSSIVGNISVAANFAAAPGWNDYVRLDGTTSCDGTEATVLDCVHGGTSRMVSVNNGLTSCSNVTAFDSESALKWECDASSLPMVKLKSVGFQTGKSLRDLLNATPAWRPMKLTVQLSGTTVLESTMTPWWSNGVQTLPTGGGTLQVLNATGNVYVLPTSGSERGYSIEAERISLVTLPGATLTKTSGANTCNESSGLASGANIQSLICTGGQRFLWIEAEADLGGIANSAGLVAANASFLLLAGSSFKNGATATGGSGVVLSNFTKAAFNTVSIDKNIFGIKLVNVDRSVFKALSISRLSLASATGIILSSGSDFNRFEETTVAGATSKGVYIAASNSNMLNKVRINNIGSYGVRIDGASDGNIIRQALITNIGDGTNGEGVSLSGSGVSSTILSHVTTAATTWNGFYANAAINSMLHQFLTLNSDIGVDMASSASGHLIQTASFTTASSVIRRDTTSSLAVSGTFVHDSARTCDNDGTMSCSGFTASAVQAANPTNAAFVGALANGSDTLNTHSASLTSLLGTTVTDWTRFENFFRAWTENTAASPFPSAANYRISCKGATCKAFDFRLANASSVLRNKSGNGSTDNSAFVAGAACPSEVDGNKTVTYLAQTFLLNAAEIMNDGIGDEDGLCETNETCSYSPHLGVYQGEGNLSNACVFNQAGGAVSGVVMKAYLVNGGI